MKLYIVQGEHPSVPGRTLSVHQDEDVARIEAISLINIILNDLDQPALPDAASFEDIDKVVKSLCDEGHSCDVWLEERDLVTERVALPPEDEFADLIREAVSDHNDMDGPSWAGVARDVAKALKETV
jgi:hypothetical protein